MSKVSGRLAAMAISALLCATVVSGQLATAGQVQFPLLRMSYSSREIAMAGASIGMPSELPGSYANPATLGYLDAWQAAVAYRSMVLDLWGGLLTFGVPVRNSGYWALSILNVSEGTLDEVLQVDGNPYPTGRVWGGNQVAASLSWSRLLYRTLALGVSLKGAYHYIGTADEYYSSDGLALDMGIQYRMMHDRLIFGAVARNLGFVRSGHAAGLDKGTLPVGAGLGLSYVPRYAKALRIALDIEKTTGAPFDVQPGIELAVLKDVLFLRAGYAFSRSELSYAFEVLGGAAQEHEKAQWNRLCLGLGFIAAVREVGVNVDAALELNTVREPCLAVTLLVSL